MNRIFCVALLCMALSTTSHAQVNFAFFGSGQFTTARYKIDEVSQKTSFKPGYQAGISMKMYFDEQIFFAPAIMISQRGYKVEFSKPSFPPGNLAVDNNASFNSVDIMPALQFDFNKNPSHFYFRVGPSLEIAFAGHEKFKQLDGETVDRKVPYSLRRDYGPFSASGIFQLGHESAKGLQIYLQYSHGLSSIVNQDKGPDVRHQAIGLGIGKYF